MRTSRLIIGAGKAVAVAALLVWSLLPIAFIVMSSVKPGQEIFAVPTVYLSRWRRKKRLVCWF